MANFNNNKRKKYYRIDYDTETDAIFAMFDEVGSETESDIEELLNDSDTEFIAEEEVLPIDENDRDCSIIVPEANVHVVMAEENNPVSIPCVPEDEVPDFEILPVVTNNESSRDFSKTGENVKSTKRKRSATKELDVGKKAVTEEIPLDQTEGPSCSDRKETTNVVRKRNHNTKGDSSKAKKKPEENPFKWTKKKGKQQKKADCYLHQEVLLDISEQATPFEMFCATLQLDELVEVLVEQSNLYARQNGREFQTNVDEIKAFLGVNYVMSINKLPNLKTYWQIDEYVGNVGVRNILTRKRFMDILRNLHFADNEMDDKTDRGYKIRPIINHLNFAFQIAVSNSDTQAIDEHMTKFKGKHGARQYLKNKPIKWGFKWWCRADSRNGYLYQFDLYLGKKESVEHGLGESVVMELCRLLEKNNCSIFCDNFFTSPVLVKKMLEKGVYVIGTIRRDRKFVPALLPDKAMKRGDIHFHFDKDTVICQWFDNRSVVLAGPNVDGIHETSSVMRREKGKKGKIAVPCPNIVKSYNSNMGGVDILDQKTAAYRLDRKSSGGRYYLRLFFDLMDMACVNAHIVTTLRNPRAMDLLDFKQVVAKGLIGKYNTRSRAPPSVKISKRSFMPASVPLHLPEIDSDRGKCAYCKNEKPKEQKTFIKCSSCGVYLCIIPGANSRNCFKNYHYEFSQ